MSKRLNPSLEAKLIALGQALIDQQAARVIVEPQRREAGCWFGGGNVVQAPDGTWYLVGRYRNHGDSRTGLSAGERGFELAIFASHDQGQTWEKKLAFTKADLNVGTREVLSIEGSALRWNASGIELFVSTEKTNIGYPNGLETFLKPGTGVWTIEALSASDLASLREATATTVLQTDDPQFIHVKDPFLFEPHHGTPYVLYCTHPFSWSSSNTAYALQHDQPINLSASNFSFFPRGTTWDVAMTRGTAIIPVPAVGAFADQRISLIFYDGGECLRNLDEHAAAVRRPRGYSCEELGGLAYTVDDDLNHIYRLSTTEPMFVSPYGTGCSRYVDVLATETRWVATWQQSQDDRSQPLVMHQLSHDQIHQFLS